MVNFFYLEADEDRRLSFDRYPRYIIRSLLPSKP